MIPTKLVSDFVKAVQNHQREAGNGDLAIIKHPSGNFVVLVGLSPEITAEIGRGLSLR